jgi:hypothetical protein
VIPDVLVEVPALGFGLQQLPIDLFGDAGVTVDRPAPKLQFQNGAPLLVGSGVARRGGLHLQAHKEFKDRDVFILKLPDDGTAFKLEPKAPGTRGDTYPSSLTFPGFKISMLAQILTAVLHRSVIDETGLDTTFDIALKWGFRAEIPRSAKDQLGLEMIEAKRPIETLVIDHIDKWPSSK